MKASSSPSKTLASSGSPESPPPGGHRPLRGIEQTADEFAEAVSCDPLESHVSRKVQTKSKVIRIRTKGSSRVKERCARTDIHRGPMKSLLRLIVMLLSFSVVQSCQLKSSNQTWSHGDSFTINTRGLPVSIYNPIFEYSDCNTTSLTRTWSWPGDVGDTIITSDQSTSVVIQPGLVPQESIVLTYKEVLPNENDFTKDYNYNLTIDDYCPKAELYVVPNVTDTSVYSLPTCLGESSSPVNCSSAILGSVNIVYDSKFGLEPYFSQDVCGNFSVTLLQEDQPDWITFYSHESYGQIANFAPPSQLEESELDLKFTVQYDEYDDLKYEGGNFTLTIMPCKLDFLTYYHSVHNTTFSYKLNESLVEVPMGNFTQTPSCGWPMTVDYRINIKSVVYPDEFQEDQLFEFNTDNDSLFIESVTRADIGDYQVFVTKTLDGYPEDYPMVSTTYVPPEFFFNMTVIDPCIDAIVEPTVGKLKIDYIFGFDVKKISNTTFLDFPDSKSLEWYRQYPDLFPNEGYSFCEDRIYSWIPAEMKDGPTPILLNGQKVQWINRLSLGVKSLGTIGLDNMVPINKLFNYTLAAEDQAVMAGNYLILLKALLKQGGRSTTIPVEINLYRLETALEIDEVHYDMTLGEQIVKIPFPEFTPPLPYTESVAVALTGLHPDWGIFEFGNMQLVLFIDMNDKDFDVNNFEDAYRVRVDYSFSPALQEFEYNFSFTINIQKPELDPEKPFFEVVYGNAEIEYGQAFNITIPRSGHPKDYSYSYQRVDLGAAGMFAEFDGVDLITINSGKTTSKNIGTYLLTASLIDEFGTMSEPWKYQLDIIAPKAIVFDFFGQLKNETDKKEQRVFPPVPEGVGPPTAKIQDITNTGKVVIAFTNEMDDQESYIRGLINAFNENKSGRRLQENGGIHFEVIPGDKEFTDMSNLQFDLVLASYSPTEISLEVKFEKPLYISTSTSGEADTLKIKFDAEDVFIDKYGQPLESSSTELISKLPKQFPYEREAQILGSTKAAVGNSALYVSLGNFLINFLMAGAMNLLWDLIISQQIVILLPLFSAQLPVNSGIIFGGIMQVAAFDIIDTDSIYEWLELDGKDPINENFETVGFEFILLLPNLGSIAIFLGLSPLYFIVYFLLGFCDVWGPFARRRKAMKQSLFYGYYIRIIMESYLIVFVCCLININRLDWSDDWNRLNSYMTIGLTVVFSLFPLVTTAFLWYRFKSMEKTSFQKQFGELYAGLCVDEKGILVYLLIDYGRKVLMAAAVAIFTEYLWAQAFCLIMSSLAIVISVGFVKVKHNWDDRVKIIVNEMVLLTLMYHNFIFTDYVPDPEIRYMMGYSQIVVIIAGLIYNMSKVFIQTFYQIKKAFRKWNNNRLAVSYLQKVIQKRDSKGLRKINGKAFNQRRKKAMDKILKEIREEQMEHIEQVMKDAEVRRAIRAGLQQEQIEEILEQSLSGAGDGHLPEINVSNQDIMIEKIQEVVDQPQIPWILDEKLSTINQDRAQRNQQNEILLGLPPGTSKGRTQASYNQSFDQSSEIDPLNKNYLSVQNECDPGYGESQLAYGGNKEDKMLDATDKLFLEGNGHSSSKSNDQGKTVNDSWQNYGSNDQEESKESASAQEPIRLSFKDIEILYKQHKISFNDIWMLPERFNQFELIDSTETESSYYCSSSSQSQSSSEDVPLQLPALAAEVARPVTAAIIDDEFHQTQLSFKPPTNDNKTIESILDNPYEEPSPPLQLKQSRINKMYQVHMVKKQRMKLDKTLKESQLEAPIQVVIKKIAPINKKVQGLETAYGSKKRASIAKLFYLNPSATVITETAQASPSAAMTSSQAQQIEPNSSGLPKSRHSRLRKKSQLLEAQEGEDFDL